jgi:zinc finger protein
MPQEEMEIVEGERCPYCLQKTLTLAERVIDIPYFGVTHVFSMDCQNEGCGYFFSDVEAEEQKGKVKQTFKVTNENDLKVRVVKSSSATIKIPRMVELPGGDNASGYITNVEGLLNRFKKILEELTQDDDKDVAKKAKNHLKKLGRVLWGRDEITIHLEDSAGNSGFILNPQDPQ